MGLGCLENAFVRIIRSGQVIFNTQGTAPLQTTWVRTGDEVSSATFVIPVTATCCPPQLHAWTDIVEFERNGIVQWSGYVMKPTLDESFLTFEANDLAIGYSRRIIRDPFDHVGVDISDIFKDYQESADGPDPVPVIPVYEPTGILATRMVTTAEYRNAWDAMKELLDTGLDISMVGSIAYIGPFEERGLKSLLLTEAMILGQATTGEDGSSFANRVIVKGMNGLVSIVPAGPAVATPPFPLTELVVDANDIDDQDSLDDLAMQHWMLRSVPQTFVSFADGVMLKDDSPYPLEAYVPGRLVDVRITNDCYSFTAGMRISGVAYSLDGASEQIKVSLNPMGVVADPGAVA